MKCYTGLVTACVAKEIHARTSAPEACQQVAHGWMLKGTGCLGNATCLCGCCHPGWCFMGFDAWPAPKQRDKLCLSISPLRPCPFFPSPCFLLRSVHQLCRTWLYFICVHKALPCPAGLRWPALKKRQVLCCSDIFGLAGLRMGLMVPAALSDPMPLLWHCFLSNTGAALCMAAATASGHLLCFRSVLSLCSSCLQTPFISPCHALQPAFFHLLLSARGNALLKPAVSLIQIALWGAPLQWGMSPLHPVWQWVPRRAPRRPTPCWQRSLLCCLTSGNYCSPLCLSFSFWLSSVFFCSGWRLLRVRSLTVPWQPSLSRERSWNADNNRSAVSGVPATSRVPTVSHVPALPLVCTNHSLACVSRPLFGGKWALPGRRFGLCGPSCTFAGTVKTKTWLCLFQHWADCSGGLSPALDTRL